MATYLVLADLQLIDLLKKMMRTRFPKFTVGMQIR
jgi:hypothetical protein